MNQQTGYDLHRPVDARKAAEWAVEHRPTVAWCRIPCRYWGGANNEKTLSGRRREAFDPKLYGSRANLVLLGN